MVKHDFLGKHYILYRASGELKRYDTSEKCCKKGCADKESNRLMSEKLKKVTYPQPLGMERSSCAVLWEDTCKSKD